MTKCGFVWIAMGVGMLGCRTTQTVSNDQASLSNLAPFQVVRAWVDGDSLRSVVQYSGGCDGHDFSLRKTSPLQKSLPPKQPIAWDHRSDDPCRALVVDTISTSVVHLRGTPHGVTILLLDQWEFELPYTYP
jgi:hypothetical protein|tara:strand:- start:1339 stop:1734 length:396 start_codon:yes stop_codon:yes gene_type:complete